MTFQGCCNCLDAVKPKTLLIIPLFSSATTLECFQCSSIYSMEDCIEFQKKIRCPKETDYCRNMTVRVYVQLLKDNVTGFQRGCASQYECLDKSCTGHFAEKYGEKENAYNFCRMDCCQENLCPEGNATTSTRGPEVGARQSGADTVKLVIFSVPAAALLTLLL